MNEKLKEILLAVVRFIAAYAVIYLVSCVATICVLPKLTPYETRYLFLIFLLTSLIVILAIPLIRNWILGKAEKEENDKAKSILLAIFALVIYLILLFSVFMLVLDYIFKLSLSDTIGTVIYYIFLMGSLAVTLGVSKIRNWVVKEMLSLKALVITLKFTGAYIVAFCVSCLILIIISAILVDVESNIILSISSLVSLLMVFGVTKIRNCILGKIEKEESAMIKRASLVTLVVLIVVFPAMYAFFYFVAAGFGLSKLSSVGRLAIKSIFLAGSFIVLFGVGKVRNWIVKEMLSLKTLVIVVKFTGAYIVTFLISCLILIIISVILVDVESNIAVSISSLVSLLVVFGVSKIRNWILEKGKKENKEDKTEEVVATENNAIEN